MDALGASIAQSRRTVALIKVRPPPTPHSPIPFHSGIRSLAMCAFRRCSPP